MTKMDKEGYPDKKELQRIKTWDVKDVVNLMDFIEGLHIYPDYVSRKIIKDRIFDKLIIEWSVATGGWSGNESLVYALLDNFIFQCMWYFSWQRGGKYVFHIDLEQVRYKLVSEYCRENKVSRQSVSKSPHLFDHYKISKNKVFIRRK